MRFLIIIFIVYGLWIPIGQGQDLEKVEIVTHNVAPNVFMLVGEGGNIGVLTGEDGVLVIDDQFAELAPKIKLAIARLNPNEIRFVVNTHLHGDHVGGNEALAKDGAIVVAHSNVRERMSTEPPMEGQQREAATNMALPVITFGDQITFHFDDQEIRVFHGPPAHTDGDVAIWIKESNVIHTGDLFVTYGFPYIDETAGGSLNGMIDFLAIILEVIDDQTKVIPGHGPVSSKSDIEEFRAKLMEIRSKILPLIQAGKSLDEIVTINPLAEYDEIWPDSWIKSKDFIATSYNAIKADLE